ncbi:LPXTG cell wall anchor domain-containing protein [Enterococcus lemanii]|uniref:LPXTG cell wall anchor domain-containing protein n=1 Tax=Enterococcus lemanii TaxID=1159752 RepID=UPI00195A2E99|nr:LPXTG cell wall anchor domain-containing protein [Enterococcus lemanii]MBM7710054.1 LPXTG-motif cell wall-anchored protein [Enterococcus lemanii]
MRKKLISAFAMGIVLFGSVVAFATQTNENKNVVSVNKVKDNNINFTLNLPEIKKASTTKLTFQVDAALENLEFDFNESIKKGLDVYGSIYDKDSKKLIVYFSSISPLNLSEGFMLGSIKDEQSKIKQIRFDDKSLSIVEENAKSPTKIENYELLGNFATTNNPDDWEQPEDKPTEPDQGGQPEDKPTEPEQGGQPEDKPTEPDQGGQPEDKPTEPDQGGQPGDKPTEPDQGGQPGDKPTEPDQDGQPGDKPTEPDQDGQPEDKPTAPDQDGQPEDKPTAPDQDGQPEDKPTDTDKNDQSEEQPSAKEEEKTPNTNIDKSGSSILPQMGEKSTTLISIAGIGLMIAALGLYYYKKK